ncbi:hypothetical protein Tco_0656590 [Tanacetum coccineum]|uniref:Uncharacterized protein n=1 Tax=Tanacetum coccineum TaxID=301880 RepID=A0ABQ4X9E4_9ASTR
MSSPKFAEMHNVVAFLEKPVESDRFAEIIDFLKASSVHYALPVNPIIYTSCIEQFWATAKEIAALKKRIQRLERKKMLTPTGLKRLTKVGMSRRVESSEDQESLGAPEDASKQRRSIADLDKNDDVTLVDETQERQDDELITAGEAVTTASVEDSDVPTTIEEITLAQTLIQIKAAKPKVKDQIALDEQIARDIQAKLDAELIEEQKLARKQEEEANIALIESWENTQAMMEADRLLAERLQSKEREELTDKEKGKLFMK